VLSLEIQKARFLQGLFSDFLSLGKLRSGTVNNKI
jgi:hypothetical protein